MRVSLQIKFPVRDFWNTFKQATSGIFLLKKIIRKYFEGIKQGKTITEGSSPFILTKKKCLKTVLIVQRTSLWRVFCSKVKIVKDGISVSKWFTLCSCFLIQHHLKGTQLKLKFP